MSAFQDPDIYRDILDGLQIGVSVLDLQNVIVFWSDGAEHITGYSRMDVLGHSCAENVFLHCNQDSCEMCTGVCPNSSALRDGKPIEAMIFIHHKSGYRTQVHVWAIPLRDKHGVMIGLIQTFEAEFAIGGPEPSERGTGERGFADEATGLPNEAMMQSHLREMLGTFKEFRVSFGVICLELPELMQFRARYGQVAARSILQVLAHTLKNTVWPTDFVGRWSGERFLAILSNCPQDALQTVAQRILNMTETASIQWWGEQLSTAVTIGSTVVAPGDTIELLMARAQVGLRGGQGTSPEDGDLASMAADPHSSKG